MMLTRALTGVGVAVGGRVGGTDVGGGVPVTAARSRVGGKVVAVGGALVGRDARGTAVGRGASLQAASPAKRQSQKKVHIFETMRPIIALVCLLGVIKI